MMLLPYPPLPLYKALSPVLAVFRRFPIVTDQLGFFLPRSRLTQETGDGPMREGAWTSRRGRRALIDHHHWTGDGCVRPSVPPVIEVFTITVSSPRHERYTRGDGLVVFRVVVAVGGSRQFLPVPAFTRVFLVWRNPSCGRCCHKTTHRQLFLAKGPRHPAQQQQEEEQHPQQDSQARLQLRRNRVNSRIGAQTSK